MGDNESLDPNSPEARRLRRQQRILANADNRLNKILCGPDGGEKRMAPALEGGEGFRNIPTPSVVDDKCSTPGTATGTTAKVVQPSLFTRLTLLLFVRMKLLLIIILGASLRVFMGMNEGQTFNIVVPWLIFYASCSLLGNFLAEDTQQDDSLKIVYDMMSNAGLNGNVLKYFVQFYGWSRVCFKDTVTLIAGFIITHSVIAYLDANELTPILMFPLRA